MLGGSLQIFGLGTLEEVEGGRIERGFRISVPDGWLQRRLEKEEAELWLGRFRRRRSVS